MATVIGKVKRLPIKGTVASRRLHGAVHPIKVSGRVTANLIHGASGYVRLAAVLKKKTLKIKLTELILRDHQIISGEDMAYAKRLDTINDNLFYNGEAPAGTLDASPRWRIKRTTITGDDVTVEYAEGTDKFDKVWDDRLTYNYR